MDKKRLLPLAILFPLFFFGCSIANGPLFKEVPLADYNGKAIVYFYRNSPPLFLSTLDLSINEGNALPLQNKGYYLLILEPGVYRFTVAYRSWLNAEITFTLRSNEIYYLRYRGDVVVGYIPGPFGKGQIFCDSITLVPRNEGDAGLARLPAYHGIERWLGGMMNKILMAVALSISLMASGCYRSRVNVDRDKINYFVNNINYNGNICRNEADVIAQQYLLSTKEEPCHAEAENFNIDSPYRAGILEYYDKKTDQHNISLSNPVYLVGFKRYGFLLPFTDDVALLYVAVDRKTGQPFCLGKWWRPVSENQKCDSNIVYINGTSKSEIVSTIEDIAYFNKLGKSDLVITLEESMNCRSADSRNKIIRSHVNDYLDKKGIQKTYSLQRIGATYQHVIRYKIVLLQADE